MSDLENVMQALRDGRREGEITTAERIMAMVHQQIPPGATARGYDGQPVDVRELIDAICQRFI